MPGHRDERGAAIGRQIRRSRTTKTTSGTKKKTVEVVYVIPGGADPRLRLLTSSEAQSHREIDTGPAGRPEARLLVPPRILASTLGVDIVPLAPLRAVISIVGRPGHGPSSWSMLSANDLVAALRAAFLPDWSQDEPHELLRSGADAAPVRNAGRLDPEQWTRMVSAARFERGDGAMAKLLECLAGVLA